MNLTFAPSGVNALAKSVEMFHEQVAEAGPGDNIGVNVSVAQNVIKRGNVGSDSKNKPAVEVESFRAQIIMLKHPGQIRKGYTPVIDVHTCHIACQFTEIE